MLEFVIDSKTTTAAIPIPQQATSCKLLFLIYIYLKIEVKLNNDVVHLDEGGGSGGGGSFRPRTVSDSKEHHRKSFQIPETSRADVARSFDSKSDPYHSSPFRPSDPSHLLGSSPGIRRSPSSGSSPGQYSSAGLYHLAPPPGTSYDSRSTPVGSYSHPFAFQQYMVRYL